MSEFPLQETGYEIIDCHVHPALTPDTMLAWFDPPESPEAFVEWMKHSGITRACGAYAHSADPSDFSEIADMNRISFEFRDRFPEFYIPAIQVHPRFPKKSCEELDRCYHNEGVRWIGELVGYMMGYKEKYTSKGAYEIFSLAQDLNVPVNFHCAGLDVISAMCEAFPRLPFVLAHPQTKYQAFLDRLDLVIKYDNLHLDLSGSGIMRWGMIRYGIDRAGMHKFVFGTDFPISNPAKYVACVLYESLTHEEREAVFSGNFKRLTGIQ